MKEKGMLKVKEDVVENKPLDLKDLLDDKKIRISFTDIFVDWMNFRKSYYWIKLEYQKVPDTKIPFEKKDMTVKSFFNEIFVEERFRKTWKYFIYLMVIYVYVIYRIESAEKRNSEAIKKLGNFSNAENKEELNKYKKFI